MAAVSVSSSGTASASAYGVTVNSSGNVDLSGLVTKVMSVLDGKAPNFVKALVNAAAQVGLETAALEGAIATATAALPAEVGGAIAVLGPFAPVAAIVMAVPALLLTLDPASGGTGCCGERPYTRAEAAHQWLFENGHINMFTGEQIDSYQPTDADLRTLLKYSGYGSTAAPCDPSEYEWGAYQKAPAGTAEAFVNAAIEAAYAQASGCWSSMAGPEYPMVLAAAIGAWQRAHPSSPVSFTRTVNITRNEGATSTFDGQTYGGNVGGQPQDEEPISVAMNYAAVRFDDKGNGTGFLVKPGALATYESPAPLPARMTKAVIGAASFLKGAISVLSASPPAPQPAPADANLVTIEKVPAPAPAQVSSWDSPVPYLGGTTYRQVGWTAGIATGLAMVLRILRH